MCRTYWRAGARHYRVAVMTRASQQAPSTPGVRPLHSLLDTKEHRRSNLINDPPMNAFTHAEDLPMQFAGNVSAQYQIVWSLSKYGFQVESAVVTGPMAPERVGPTLSRGLQIAAGGFRLRYLQRRAHEISYRLYGILFSRCY